VKQTPLGTLLVYRETEYKMLRIFMETSAITIDDQVDIVLHKIAMSPNLTLNVNELYEVSVMNESTYLIDHFMLEKGLLKMAGENRTMTGKGLEIANFGGWLSYQKQFKRERPRFVQGIDTRQFRQESEMASLRGEIERYKLELLERAEKELASAQVIKSLIEQNKSSKLMFFIGGIAIGLLAASVLSYVFFD
jgi:hypothetical protein